MNKEDSSGRVRLDKWLWVARFYKTRSLAADAVQGGAVRLHGERCKPAHALRPGDVLDIRIGLQVTSVVVQALDDRRGPAPQARLLYEETAESLARREAAEALRQAGLAQVGERAGRPTKRDRRQIRRFTEG